MVVQVRCGYLVVRDVNSFVPTCLHTVYVIYCASKLHVFQWSSDTMDALPLCNVPCCSPVRFACCYRPTPSRALAKNTPTLTVPSCETG